MRGGLKPVPEIRFVGVSDKFLKLTPLRGQQKIELVRSKRARLSKPKRQPITVF